MAAARLRRTFHYPSDNDDDLTSSNPAALDEEHQEQLIASLRAQDAAQNARYRAAFLSIPVLGAVLFLYTFFAAASTASERLVALLAIASLACTGYILHFKPIEGQNTKGKTPIYKSTTTSLTAALQEHLIPLNALLAALVALSAITSWRAGRAEHAWRESLPAIILGLSLLARWQLAPLDLEELKRARYELKGA